MVIQTDSNEGELLAVRRARELFPQATIKTDSQYAVDKAASYGLGNVQKVKGHAGVAGNMHADNLAKNGTFHPNYQYTVQYFCHEPLLPNKLHSIKSYYYADQCIQKTFENPECIFINGR